MNTDAILQWIDQQQKAMLDKTLALAEINTGSANLAGLAEVADTLLNHFSVIAEKCELIELSSVEKMNFDGQLEEFHTGRALMACTRPEAPLQVLLCGHMDTVFAVDSHFQQCRFLDENRVNGPGVADMKGGLMVMLTALEALEKSADKERIGWTVIINPDEETGSMSSVPLLLEAAAKAHAGLVYEPALPDGTLAGERKGSGNFAVQVKGVSAHAGREFERGRNAIAGLAEVMTKLHQLNAQREGVTFNLGRISGGTALNAVADQATCHFNIRTRTHEDQHWAEAQIDQILAETNAQDGLSAQLYGKFTRPPKTLSPANQQLFAWLEESSSALDVAIHTRPTGGCCDGNNLADAGLPNIDTLGVRGAHIHTDQEFMLVDSLAERAKLSYLLLLKLIENAEQAIANRALSSSK